MKSLVNLMFAAVLAAGIAIPVAQAAEPAKELAKSEVKALIQTAKTPEDHLKLAAHYRAEAAQLQAEAKEHVEMAADYDANKINHPIPKSPTLGQHCRDLAKRLTEAADVSTSMAVAHEGMAKNAK